MTGGYQSALKLFLDNAFILDDHRVTLVPIQRMKHARADHATLYFKDKIYVFGGMSSRADGTLESLAHCEVYSIKEDSWQEIAPMS